MLPDWCKQKLTKVANDPNDDAGKKDKLGKKHHCRIGSSRAKVFNVMIEKSKTHVNSSSLNEMIVIDSFNGANHLESLEDKIDLISFSSIIMNKELLSLPRHSIGKAQSF